MYCKLYSLLLLWTAGCKLNICKTKNVRRFTFGKDSGRFVPKQSWKKIWNLHCFFTVKCMDADRDSFMVHLSAPYKFWNLYVRGHEGCLKWVRREWSQPFSWIHTKPCTAAPPCRVVRRCGHVYLCFVIRIAVSSLHLLTSSLDHHCFLSLVNQRMRGKSWMMGLQTAKDITCLIP